MAEEPPKLFTNKPKKAQVKQFQEQRAKEVSKPMSSSSSSSSSQSQPPPPPPPKESFARRYKFLWPMLLTVNLAVGGSSQLLVHENEKERNDEEDKTVSPVLTASTAPAHTEEISPPLPAIVEPVKLREPIPENQQRELFKWMLDEKRKLKPQGPEEKTRIDEEKALLKQLIRAKSIPSI